MRKTDESAQALARWMGIPAQLRRAVRGMPESELDKRAGRDKMTMRETVHHLVEANLVASGIVIAAVAKSGSSYDWTWVNPSAAWMRRLGYDKAPIGPAIATLSALSRHIGGILSASPTKLRCTVQLFDAPGAPRYTKTVRQVLLDEVSHASEHLQALQPRPVCGKVPRGRRTTARNRT